MEPPPQAKLAHGSSPQLLIEKILRERIFECRYWKERCFGVSAASILDRAYELQYIGGAYANQRPTDFLCLTLKLLQIFPEKVASMVGCFHSELIYSTMHGDS